MSDYDINLIFELALDGQELCGSYQIDVQKSGDREVRTLSVAEILADKERFDGALTRDPLEPEYDNGRIVGKLFLAGETPKLVSKARGVASYRLVADGGNRTSSRVSIEYSNERNDAFVDDCIAQMRATGAFYRSGMTVVQMRNGLANPVNEPRLAYELSKIVLPYQVKVTRQGEVRQSIKFDKSILGQILEVASDRLPVLNGFADHPLVRPNGQIVTEPGYGQAAGLFVLNGASRFPKFYDQPNDEQLKQAVETCLRPFRGYRFEDEYGRTAAFFAQMLAVLRPVFSCDPMIVTTSNVTGVGKGYFQHALAIVRTEELAELRNLESKNTSEFRKMLFTLLYEGRAAIALDNQDGPLKNETLYSFVTAPVWSDHVLGQSKSGGSLRSDALLLLNGCKVSFGKNIARKVLRICLKKAGAGHRYRDFGFLPHEEARKHRKEIISAVMTTACRAKHAARPRGTIGSFEEVNDLIRVPIADIAKRFPDLGLRDPLGLFKETVENDVDSLEEVDILEQIYDVTEG